MPPRVMAKLALETASSPRVLPTFVSWVFCKGAGSDPERSTATRSLASFCSCQRIHPRTKRDAAAIVDLRLDDRRAHDLLVEHDGHAPADVLAGQLAHQVTAAAVHGEEDLGGSHLGEPDLGVGQVVPGDPGPAVEQVGPPGGRHPVGAADAAGRLDRLVAELAVVGDGELTFEASDELLEDGPLLGHQVDDLPRGARLLVAPAIGLDGDRAVLRQRGGDLARVLRGLVVDDLELELSGAAD